MVDEASERYAHDVAAALATALGPRLVGVYLHGSAVLGGYDARRSDIDVLAVTDRPVSAADRAGAAARLAPERLPCPAEGLELSVVTRAAAAAPTAAPPFELHLTTAPEDRKVVDGHGHPGDPDLVLHFAVCRAAGRVLGAGPAAPEVFAAVPEELVLGQLAGELSWAADHAPSEYAVLNACRAWRYAVDGALVSKVDGGRWALPRLPPADRALVAAALDRQRRRPAAGSDTEPDRAAVRAFLDATVARWPRRAR